MNGQIARFAAAIMTTLLALVVLWQFRIVLMYVLVSLMLAAALRPLAQHLAGGTLLVRAAWAGMYLAALGGAGGLFFLAGEAAFTEIQVLAYSLSAQDAWLLPVWLQGSIFQQTVIGRLPPPSMLFEALTGDHGQLVLPAILGMTQDIGGLVSGAFVIVFLSIYWSSNQIHFERLWLSLLAPNQRRQARGIWWAIEPEIGSYIRSQLIQSLLAGLLLGLGYWLLGSPYPAFLALIGGLACLLPVVGPILALIPPLLVGLVTGLQLSLLTTLYTMLVLAALVIWVKPRFFQRKWDNPILTAILLIALADAFGLLGLIIAPPLSVVCQILWNRLVSNRAISGAAAQVSDLKQRQARLNDMIESMDGPALPLVASSMERLKHLIEQAEPVLQTDPFKSKLESNGTQPNTTTPQS